MNIVNILTRMILFMPIAQRSNPPVGYVMQEDRHSPAWEIMIYGTILREKIVHSRPNTGGTPEYDVLDDAVGR